MDVFVRILRYLRPYRWSIAVGLLCLLIATPAGLFHPLVWRYITDEVIGKRRILMLLPAIGVMVGTQMVGSVLSAVRSNLLEKVGQRFVLDLRNDVYRKLQGQSLAYLHENRIGDLTARVMSDIDVLQEVVIQGTDSVIASLLSFLWVVGCILALNVKVGLAMIAPLLLIAVLVRTFNIRVKSIYRASRERLGDVGARLQENLTGMVVIKAFAREEAEAERFRAAAERYFQESVRAINVRSVVLPTVQFVGFISNVLAIGVGAWLVLRGELTVGGVVAYRGFWWALYSPIYQLASVNSLLQQGIAAGNRVFALLDEEESIQDAPDAGELQWGAVRPGCCPGAVAFENVSFSYRERPVLRAISLRVEPGQRVALVGPSGSGKSTLLNLVPRFYDVQSGRVLVDGRDVRTVTQRSLRRHLAMVLQEPFLFSGTVLDNLRYGRPEATEEEIRAAVRAANALDFIEALPHGFSTEVGERGVKLSGGQRQRIAIARAFLADPQILILDEATSAVEPGSEWIIQQALDRLMEGRTTFVTSHRLSMVRNADVIAVLDEGRLVELGTHAELLAANGLYAAMYRRQMGDLSVPV